MERREKRGALAWDQMIPWLLALLVLALALFLYFSLGNKATGALEYVKNLMRFGK